MLTKCLTEMVANLEICIFSYRTLDLLDFDASWTGPDGDADSLGIQVVTHEAIDDGRQVVLEHGVAVGFNLGGSQKVAQQMAQLLGEVDDVLLSGGVHDEVVNVGHDVHADGTGEGVGGLGGGEGSGQEGGEQEDDLHDSGGGGLQDEVRRRGEEDII